MANELLDFVMSLVRDPDAAARYAADPHQAIADAHLTDVTTADVNHLIPVVSESLPSAVPSAGADLGFGNADNVWTSGAATAAFDSFGDFGAVSDHVPVVVTDDLHSAVSDLPGSFDHGVPVTVDDYSADVPNFAVDPHPVDDIPVVDTGLDTHWNDAAGVDHHAPLEDGGFDIFD
ncbi:Rv0340 family IniB-related protein [Mycobacterium sp. BMJ-28]